VCEIVSALSAVLQLENVTPTLCGTLWPPFRPTTMFTHDVERYRMHLQVTTPIHSTILLPRIVFFLFIWAILWCRPHGNHLKEDLAKFGDGNV
jgi:hypothetical protein